MPTYWVEAYDEDGLQILGNLDGQTVWRGRNYKRAQFYKDLPRFKTLNNRVQLYKIVREDSPGYASVMETVANLNHPSWY